MVVQLLSGHPQVGRASVEDDGEGLRRRADVDVAKVLRVAKVVEGLVEEDGRGRIGERVVVVGDGRDVGLRRRGRARRREEGLHRQAKIVGFGPKMATRRST